MSCASTRKTKNNVKRGLLRELRKKRSPDMGSRRKSIRDIVQEGHGVLLSITTSHNYVKRVLSRTRGAKESKIPEEREGVRKRKRWATHTQN